jgi:hypothetical protein
MTGDRVGVYASMVGQIPCSQMKAGGQLAAAVSPVIVDRPLEDEAARSTGVLRAAEPPRVPTFLRARLRTDGRAGKVAFRTL